MVGTCSTATSVVFVNLEVVQPESNIVIAAADCSLPMTRDARVMLRRDPLECPQRH